MWSVVEEMAEEEREVEVELGDAPVEVFMAKGDTRQVQKRGGSGVSEAWGEG